MIGEATQIIKDTKFNYLLSDLKILENRDSFEDKEWNELYKLSEETFVEENESLKQGGAGAGLTDND